MSKLDLNDPQVFNQWRANYEQMTNEEHTEFTEACAERFPDQVHFTAANFEKVFEQLGPSQPRVLEIGGWKGELAKHCLEKFPIKSWTNIEFCKSAIKNSKCTDRRYFTLQPERFDWFETPRVIDFDVCVSSNTIEHFSDDHFFRLLGHVAGIPTIVFEAPISNEGQTWNDYWGTHILETGWDKINFCMKACGYKVEKLTDICMVYRL
jgi:hypothetical protein